MLPIRFAVVLFFATSTLCTAQPVCAPDNADPVPIETLAGDDASSVWLTLNGLDFWGIPTAAPEHYYDTIDTSVRDRLRETLHDLIDAHTVFHYSHPSRPNNSGHRVDTWDIVALADAHPDDPSAVLDVYLNGRFERQLVGVRTDPRYDREHAWPKSLGFPTQAVRNPAYSDCHHLFAAYRSYNGDRSNRPYGSPAPGTGRVRPTLESVGRGGSLTEESLSSNYYVLKDALPPRGVWQTWLGRRGDVARAMFYMDVRYEGGPNEPDLQLTDDANLIIKRDVWRSGGDAFMGLLPTLLEWHAQDPVDDLERRRNNVVFLFQGNRNPFIDHPEWVNALFGDENVAVADALSGGSGPPPWINEIHYDNDGKDSDEFVEIAGPSGLSLDGWRLVAYNGSGGRVYDTVELDGVLPDSGDGVGFLAFPVTGLQNGAPDGLALVSADGDIVQFLSYEGEFTATGGPAEGLVSDDIGVSEPDSTPVGHSLQHTGTGLGNTAWSGPLPATPGRVNSGQSFR